MSHQDARRVLEEIVVLRNACDLDLLVFFARHRHALLTSEQLAVWLGYEIKHIAESLEVLLEARLLTRTQNPTHAARMYVFAAGGTSGGWLPRLLELGSTREGRLALLDALSRRAPRNSGGPESTANDSAAQSRPGPILGRRNPPAVPGTKVG